MCFKNSVFYPGYVAQLIEVLLGTSKVAGSIPNEGTYLSCRFDPCLGPIQEAASQCFCLSLSPPSPSPPSPPPPSPSPSPTLSLPPPSFPPLLPF